MQNNVVRTPLDSTGSPIFGGGSGLVEVLHRYAQRGANQGGPENLTATQRRVARWASFNGEK
jgi:hypothetical protein